MTSENSRTVCTGRWDQDGLQLPVCATAFYSRHLRLEPPHQERTATEPQISSESDLDCPELLNALTS